MASIKVFVKVPEPLPDSQEYSDNERFTARNEILARAIKFIHEWDPTVEVIIECYLPYDEVPLIRYTYSDETIAPIAGYIARSAFNRARREVLREIEFDAGNEGP